MGLGKVVAAAAAATPVLRDHLRHHHHYDRVHPHPDDNADDDDDWEDQDRTPTVAHAPQLPYPQPVSQTLAGRSPEALFQPAPAAVSIASSEEMARRPLLGIDAQSRSRQSSGVSQHSLSGGQGLGYGAVLDDGGGPSRLRQSPERYRSNTWLDRVPEEVALDAGDDDEDEEADGWDLAQQGYYSGSYKRIVALYVFVPLTSLLVFLALALAPTWLWPVRWPAPPTFPRLFPSPLPEFILAAALWSLAHLLRTPLWALSSLLPRVLDTLLFNLLHVLLSNVLRLAALAALRVRHDMAYPRPTWRDGAFRTVWWLALGWGAAEAAVSVAQGYGQLALYRNVMVPVERVKAILAQARGQWGSSSVTFSNNASREYMPLSPRSEHAPSPPAESNGNANVNASANGKGSADGRGSSRRAEPTPMSLEEAIRLAVDQDVEQLIHLQEREELEEVYGIPVIYIPVFVPCLQRIDSFLFSLGFELVLAWAYLLSPLSFPPGAEPAPIYSNRPLAIAFPLVVVVHLFLSLLHSPPILPWIGVHTTAYIGLLVGLGGFFTGLGLWGVLS